MEMQVFSGEDNPIGKNAYQYLVAHNLIFPGSIINRDAVEEAVGWAYDEKSWEFRGAYILLKNRIEAEGYFITQKKLEAPAFRILETEEMTAYAQRRLLKNCANNFKISLIMATHKDVSSLSEEQQKEFRRVQSQAAQSALLQQKMLFGDQFF